MIVIIIIILILIIIIIIIIIFTILIENFINKIPRKTNLIYNICSTTFRTIIIIIISNNNNKFGKTRLVNI